MAEEKSQIKKELKTFDSQFRKMSGRDPEKADKEVIRSLYLRCALDSFMLLLASHVAAQLIRFALPAVRGLWRNSCTLPMLSRVLALG